MADYMLPAVARLRPEVERCWMCGIRLPTAQMLADGGGACGNLRWYCRNVRDCTGRWTTRATKPDPGRGNGEQAARRELWEPPGRDSN
jgi:hypothetical protein